MSIVLALVLAVAAPGPVHSALEHRTSFDHAGAVVDAQYRARVSLVSRQVGAAAKAGTPITLRCVWRAHLRIEREARVGETQRLSRSIHRKAILEGSRPGWCEASRRAVADEVARRSDEIRAHLLAVAGEDQLMLKAEVASAGAGRGI